MILFFNVLVTDSRFSTGHTNRVDRLDLFKYALASYSCIDRIKQVIIYCELAEGYKSRESELIEYVHGLFPKSHVEYNNYSPSNQKQWQKMLENSPLLTTTEPILYMGNDDFVFIDYDLDMLYEGLDLMSREPQDQINSVHICSWTEAISTVYGLGEFKSHKRFWEIDMFYPDACQIVNSTFFRHIFFNLQMGDTYMRRTDPILNGWYPILGDFVFSSLQSHPRVKAFVPLREQCRHFDAYHHVNVSFDDVPKLNIPEGFFEGNIKGYTGLPQDVPLFWHSRMPAIDDTLYFYGLDDMIKVRNEVHYKKMTAPHTRGFQDPRTNNRRAPNYRHFPDHERLPLEEEYIKIGYR